MLNKGIEKSGLEYDFELEKLETGFSEEECAHQQEGCRKGTMGGRRWGLYFSSFFFFMFNLIFSEIHALLLKGLMHRNLCPFPFFFLDRR